MLGYLLTHAVDVVILDIHLGEESGLDLLTRLRAADGPAARTPVCMLSGAMADEEACRAAGADEYLVKPAGAQTLMRAVDQLMAPTARSHSVGQ